MQSVLYTIGTDFFLLLSHKKCPSKESYALLVNTVLMTKIKETADDKHNTCVEKEKFHKSTHSPISINPV